jgi:hypothetical protein
VHESLHAEGSSLFSLGRAEVDADDFEHKLGGVSFWRTLMAQRAEHRQAGKPLPEIDSAPAAEEHHVVEHAPNLRGRLVDGDDDCAALS